jgi:hypothetical protein
MINTNLIYKNQYFALSYYQNNLLLNGKVIPVNFDFNNKDETLIKDLQDEGMSRSFSQFTIAIRKQLQYDGILKWLLITIFYSLYNKRNIVVGGCNIIFTNGNFLIINSRKTKLDKNDLIGETKRIFGY